jgi:hypothetical protein
MVEKYFMLRLQPFTFFKEVHSDNNSLSLKSEFNNNNGGYKDDDENRGYEDNTLENGNDKKHIYVKLLVDDPFNNRDIILKVTKKQKGVYI